MACDHCSKDHSGPCFERVRKGITMWDVLSHYGVEVDTKGKAVCPLPKHQGERRNRPFDIFEKDGVSKFKCHSCGTT